MSRLTDFPEDQDWYISTDDYVEGLKDKIKKLEKAVEAARNYVNKINDPISNENFDKLDKLIKELDDDKCP